MAVAADEVVYGILFSRAALLAYYVAFLSEIFWT